MIALIFYYPEYLNISNGLNYWLYIGFILLIMSAVTIMVFAYLNFSVFSIIIKKVSGRYYSKN